jgi:hypothetical protein
MPLADARRSSRVAASPAEVRFAERLIGAPGHPLPGAPDAVIVDPSGTRIAGVYADHLELLEPFSARVIPYQETRPAPHIGDDALRLGDKVLHWDGRPDEQLRPAAIFDEPGLEVVSAKQGAIWTVAVQIFRSFGHHELQVHVRTQGKRDPTESEPRWKLVLRGHGTAAIAEDGRVGVAMQDGQVLIVGPSDPPSRVPKKHAELKLDHEPYAISAVAGGFVVLCAEDRDATGVPGGDWSTRIYRCTEPLQLRWRTHVVAVDAQGQPRWSTTVPFSVRQPAIEWGDAVVLAGESVARLEAGRAVWTRPSEGLSFATATGDGLVVATGRHVDIVGDDGVVRHRFAFDRGTRVTTPPAIAAQGWIAQGTSDGIYVLR